MHRPFFLFLILGTLIGGCTTSPSSTSSPQPAASSDSEQTQGNYRELSAIGTGSDTQSAPGDRPLSESFSGGPLSLDEEYATGPAQSNESDSSARADSAAAAQSPGASDTPAAGAAGFVLGEGDEIEVRMSGQPQMTTTGYVSSQGTVSLPLLGQVNIGGMAPGEAESKVATAYREGGYFTNPQINISITQYRSQQISVLGEVNKPGRYPLNTQTGLLDAVAQSGGITPKGSNNVVVIRQTEQGTRRYRLDLQQLVDGSGNQSRFSLAAGDTVFVPEAPTFYIYGEVRRPDAYAIKPGMTVMQAISTGGGLTERGSNSRIELTRDEDGETEELSPELSDRVQPGDVIFVKERFF